MIHTRHHHHETVLPLVPESVTVAGMIAVTGYAVLRSILSKPKDKPKDDTESDETK